jgi:hypothetical protein
MEFKQYMKVMDFLGETLETLLFQFPHRDSS